jgi:hypothetical protein
VGLDSTSAVSAALDRFFAHYYRRRPVNATFTGVHEYDTALPDWSPRGLATLDDEMDSLGAALSAAHPPPPQFGGYRTDVDLLDADLARGFLEIQRAENAGAHGVRRNPALWTGEALFSVIGLMIRDFAPIGERMESATARLAAIPAFLRDARLTMDAQALPAPWTARALRECDAAGVLLRRGIEAWVASGPPQAAVISRLRAAAAEASRAFQQLAEWLRSCPTAPDESLACGLEMYDLLLTRGHCCLRSRDDLLRSAHAALADAWAELMMKTRSTGDTWADVQAQITANHPVPNEYLAAFARVWTECHDRATAAHVVTWPDWPIRYVLMPEWTREAASDLYYLFYRSPAPFDPYNVYDYVVPPVPELIAPQQKHLRAWNHTTVKLNHVIHHGAIGHHLQNWHAYHHATSRIGKVAAVDCASRIGIFCGGTMAEGWACYATDVMEEDLAFLTPLEAIAQQHSRVRFLARAIIDIELHQGSMSYEAAIAFFVERAAMNLDAARAEVMKCSMFPGTAVMYWLGTQGIHDLRAEMQRRQGSRFTLGTFHDELLRHGSIPVPLIARLMTE